MSRVGSSSSAFVAHDLEKLELDATDTKLDNSAGIQENEVPDSPLFDASRSRRLVWEQDVRILPLCCWIYLLCYLDRSNIGNAKIAAKEKHHDLMTTLDITDKQLNIALMVFFVAYILFETPSNYMLKKCRPSRWITILAASWGALTMILGSVQTFSQLSAVRFLLGAVEAGLFPGFVYYLTFWYRPEERSFRTAAILASATLAGAFGGALAYAISFMDGIKGIEAWRWIFIIEGIPSVLTAPVIWFCLPDWPENATWLNYEEKVLASARLSGEYSSRGDASLDRPVAKETLLDWRLYLHYLAYIGISSPFARLSLFSPTIINGLGYTSLRANLFSVPPYALAWFITLIVSYLGDRYNRRGLACASAATVAAIAYALEGALPGDNYRVRYGSLFVAVSGSFACIPPLLGWLSSNVRGTTGAMLAIPLNVSAGGIGQIVGVWIYKDQEAPSYPTGNWTNFAFLIMTAAIALGLWAMYDRRNVTLTKSGDDKSRRWAL